MSLADDWDALPTSAPAAAKASLADEWDSIKPSEAKAAAPAKKGSVDRFSREGDSMEGAAVPVGVAAHSVSGIGATILGGWRGLATLATGGSLEDAAQSVHQTAERGTYHPDEGTGAGKVMEALASPKNPLNWPGVAAHKAGEVVADTTGSPAAGAAVETAGNVLIPGVVLKGAGKAAGALRRSALPVVDAEVIPPKQTPLAEIGQAENFDIPTVIRRGSMAVEAPGRAPLSLVPKAGESAAAVHSEAPKPTLSLVPNDSTPGRKPTLDETPPETAAKAAEAEAPKFMEAVDRAEPGSRLPITEQARRAQVLQRVGLSDARKSAIEGDPTAASTDYQTSLLDSTAGRYAKAKIEEERGALAEHGQQIVRETGGTLGMDAQTLEARGHTILSPLEDFRKWFTDQTNGLYKVARERAGGQPLALDRFNEVLGTDSKFANTDTIELRRGLQARMKELKMLNKDGNVLPATVEQAENLRQYVNEEWSPKSNGRIRELKNAIDEDVTSAAGEDTFKKARALHQMKQAIFADPKGLSSILDSEGINRKVPVEKIADTITALPNAQFAHIVETLKHVPPELAPQAQAALAEIKAHMANRVLDAGAGRVGQWGARDVTAYLNKSAVKMRLVFAPEELAKIGDLNEAGHILAKPQGYPGATVQAHNLLQRGALAALPKGGAMVGGTVGALFGAPGTGALVGDAVGSSVAGKLGDAAALKATQKRWTKLSDFPK